ncbi:hypothetical protein LPJ73_001173 [Coemansia sp. RSA 2703]|nr:hypothetical protein LPJ73_001173 [Coemansia sp. RSA 2703]
MAPKHFAPVWQHYERHEPTGRSKHHRAICKFCSYELSGQPERMKTHLQRCTNCPQHIKDEFASEEGSGTGGSGTSYGQNNFAISTASMVFERAEDGSPGPTIVSRGGEGTMSLTPLKRRRSLEIGSGAEGLAGLPWAPTANASAIAPANNAVPPAFQPAYSSIGATSGIEGVSTARLHTPSPQAILQKHHQQQQQQQQQQQSIHHSHQHHQQQASQIVQPSAALPPPPTQHAPPAAAAATAPAPPVIPTHHESSSFLGVYDNVRGYYSRLTPMNKMQTSIGPTIAPHPLIREAIAKVPKAVRERFYGCGMPLPTGIEGLRVLDLGCGAGRDCYVAAKLVGRSGEVIGVDMTDEQLRVASEFIPEYARTLGYQPHLRFVKGYIEFLSQLPELYPGSIDMCISNNAVNLSPNKELVLRSVFEILKEGGEFQFSDIYADRRLPNHVRSHPVLMGECLGGALYTEDFKRLCQRVGFVDARQVSPPALVRIEAPELRDLVGATQFYSITFRLFKFARPASVLEPTREDYGQVAIYRGTIEGQRARTRFDNEWAFEANRPVLVDGNTAIMLGESWLRRHFEVRGDRSLHFGKFTQIPPCVQYEPWETDHELEEYDPSDERQTRRRGILPLPTPYFINGLKQQGQKQSATQALNDSLRNHHHRSQSGSRQSSPAYESHVQPPPPPPLSDHRGSSMRDHPTTFPRLSSFSISQSNVRADGAIARSTASGLRDPQQQQQQQSVSSPRFILPVNRLSSGNKPVATVSDSLSAPTTALAPVVSPRFSSGIPVSQPPPSQSQQQHQKQPQQHLKGIGSSGSIVGSTGSPSVRSGSVGSPITPSGQNMLQVPTTALQHRQPSSFAMPSSDRSPISSIVSASPRQHSPASVINQG